MLIFILHLGAFLKWVFSVIDVSHRQICLVLFLVWKLLSFSFFHHYPLLYHPVSKSVLINGGHVLSNNLGASYTSVSSEARYVTESWGQVQGVGHAGEEETGLKSEKPKGSGWWWIGTGYRKNSMLGTVLSTFLRDPHFVFTITLNVRHYYPKPSLHVPGTLTYSELDDNGELASGEQGGPLIPWQ